MATSKNCLASWQGRHTCYIYVYLASPWNVNVITILQPVIGMRITDAAGPPESMQTSVGEEVQRTWSSFRRSFASWHWLLWVGAGSCRQILTLQVRCLK